MALRRIAIEHRWPHNRMRQEHTVLDNDRFNAARTATLRPAARIEKRGAALASGGY
jgi:hypothetical protein